MKEIVYAFVAAVMVLGILHGCRKEDDELSASGADYSRNYVDMYVCPLSMEMDFYPYNPNILRVELDGRTITSHTHEEDVLNEFLSLAEMYGDTAYNRKMIPYSNQALSLHMCSLSVVCDRDFAGIPAGESLDGVVWLYAASAYDYISNGYKEVGCDYPENWESAIYPPDYYVPVCRRPGHFGDDGLKMLYPECAVYFDSVPADKEEYTFTVTFDFDDGSSVSRKVSHVF